MRLTQADRRCEAADRTVGDKESCIMHERLFGTKGVGGAIVPARDSSSTSFLIGHMLAAIHLSSTGRMIMHQITVERILFQVISFDRAPVNIPLSHAVK